MDKRNSSREGGAEEHKQQSTVPPAHPPEMNRREDPQHSDSDLSVTETNKAPLANAHERVSGGPLSRRAFLATAASSFTAAVAAACGRSRATPTPPPSLLPTLTPTPVAQSSLLPAPGTPVGDHALFLPYVNNPAGAGAALASEPTLTPTPPKPTNTPRPTATPTPIATPFPPGPPSKLGLFVARNHPQLFELLETQAVTVVKTLELDRNFVAQIKQTSPRTLVIGRIDLPQISLSDLDPAGAARAFVDLLLPVAEDPQRRQYIDGWEAYNEPVAANADEMRRLGEFEAERTRLLAERGLRSVVGNFGTGQPALELWEQFLPAVQAVKDHDGWLGLHEYSAPTIYFLTTRADQGRYPGVGPGDTGWLTLRYRQVYNQLLNPRGLTVPLIMTECGVDGLVTNRPGPLDAKGWQDFKQYWAENGYGMWGPGAYVEQLVWYDEAMRQNDYVVGGCIYVLAGSQGWESYDILGPAASVLEQYLSVHAPV